MQWQVFGASVAGLSHLDSGRPCEDAHLSDVSSERVILAVADGAGSARLAQTGAWAVANAFVHGASAKLWATSTPETTDAWREWATDLVAYVRGRVESIAWDYGHGAPVRQEEAEEASQRSAAVSTELGDDCVADERHDSTPRPLTVGDAPSQTRASPQPYPEIKLSDLASTLVGVVLTHDWLIAVHVGDGLAIARVGDQQYHSLTTPDHGEYINETTFITSTAMKTSLRIVVEPARSVSGLALMSDGLERLAFDFRLNEPHGPFFDSIFGFASRRDIDLERKRLLLAEDLNSERVNQRTDDDKTLLIAVRMNEQGEEIYPTGGEGSA